MSNVYKVSMDIELKKGMAASPILEWKNHVERALDLESYPEISSISNVSVLDISSNVNISSAIVELFENLLESKNISIPCDDKDEENERINADNQAKLYGTEYWTLIDQIEALLN